MKPRKSYVLLGEVKEDLTTEGGLILTASITSGTKPGKVIAVGPEVDDVVPGQHVICNWKESIPVDVGGIMMVLIKEDQVLAISKDVA